MQWHIKLWKSNNAVGNIIVTRIDYAVDLKNNHLMSLFFPLVNSFRIFFRLLPTKYFEFVQRLLKSWREENNKKVTKTRISIYFVTVYIISISMPNCATTYTLQSSSCLVEKRNTLPTVDYARLIISNLLRAISSFIMLIFHHIKSVFIIQEYILTLISAKCPRHRSHFDSILPMLILSTF